MKRREFITLLGGVAIAWHALNDHRILLGSDWRCCKQTSRGGVHDDTQIEDPLSHSAGTVFSQSDMCSRVYLQGIYKGYGELEAGLRIWNISVYVHRGTARRRGSISGEDGFSAMPRRLNGYSSSPTCRGICRQQHTQH